MRNDIPEYERADANPDFSSGSHVLSSPLEPCLSCSTCSDGRPFLVRGSFAFKQRVPMTESVTDQSLSLFCTFDGHFKSESNKFSLGIRIWLRSISEFEKTRDFEIFLFGAASRITLS